VLSLRLFAGTSDTQIAVLTGETNVVAKCKTNVVAKCRERLEGKRVVLQKG
jgi:hypothetical protein